MPGAFDKHLLTPMNQQKTSVFYGCNYNCDFILVSYHEIILKVRHMLKCLHSTKNKLRKEAILLKIYLKTVDYLMVD